MPKTPKFKFFFCLTAVLLAYSNSPSASSAQDWAKLSTPNLSPNGSQSIGTYTNGCLSGAATLPLNGTGYQVMRLSRNRYYGHPNLIQFIQNLGQKADSQKLGALLIGDLGQVRGGPTLSGHKSHQTGLDVDIWFLLSEIASQRLLTADERETWNANSLVDLNTDTLNRKLWSPAHKQILQHAALQPEVERIFVNPSIKRELCQQKTAADAWIHKIRPWWKHDDHFHVRLKCPDNNPWCEKQDSLPAGDGCDASLAWWFSAEAKNPSPKVQPPAPPQVLPELCEQILRE
jgi:penicillin-insensitive murein endopeptidase